MVMESPGKMHVKRSWKVLENEREKILEWKVVENHFHYSAFTVFGEC